MVAAPKQTQSKDAFLSVHEVAVRLRVADKTVRRWLKKGTMRGARINGVGEWRIRRSEVERALPGSSWGTGG